MQYAHIGGLGFAVPVGRLHNAELAARFNVTDEWIISRTGIAERRIAGTDDATSVLATRAGRDALAMAHIRPDEIDLTIVATSSPDYVCTPTTACLVQNELGAVNSAAFDLNAACTGFIYALHVGNLAIRAEDAKVVLVVGADTYSRTIINPNDLHTSILFGDGAGAVVLRASEVPGGVKSTYCRADGSGADVLKVPAGGSFAPFDESVLEGNERYLRMAGKATFLFAVEAAVKAIKCAAAQVGLEPGDIDIFIPHQANRRIIMSVANELSIPAERFFINIERYGNTSAASIPIAMTEANTAGRLSHGQIVACLGFGGGLNYGATVIEWTSIPTLPA